MKENDFAILTLYVDCILLTGINTSLLKQLKDTLVAQYAMADMGKVGLVLGMTDTRDHEQGTLTTINSQTSYIESILERYDMSSFNSVCTRDRVHNCQAIIQPTSISTQMVLNSTRQSWGRCSTWRKSQSTTSPTPSTSYPGHAVHQQWHTWAQPNEFCATLKERLT